MIAQKKDVIRFALIGCGRISQSHLQALASLPTCRLEAVADTREQAAKGVAGQYGCKAFSDYHQLMEEITVDAVIVCSPPQTHTEIALTFLENGVHVLCEKPFAMDSAQALEMVQKADEKDCLIMMASKFRYVDDIIRAKGIVESGILGEIVLFENVFCSKVDMKDRWNSVKEISGGGVLIDNGCHSVDIARYLFGPVTKVQAEEGKRVQKLEVEDTARLFFKAQNGTMGAVDLSWSIHKEQPSYFDLFGTEGVLSIGWKASQYRQSEKLDWIRFGKGYDKIAAFRKQLENFANCIRGEEMPLINGIDGLESVKVIEAAYRSMEMNKWVEVETSSR
jgi:predicted dehydrogenase